MNNKLYLLDTNVLIDFIDGVDTVIEHVLNVGVRSCCMSVISLHELYFGAQLARERKEEFYDKEMKKISKLQEYFTVLPLEKGGELYGHIKYVLRKKGKMADEFDMLIASQALCEGLTVVTDNVKHFENIPNLNIENWTER